MFRLKTWFDHVIAQMELMCDFKSIYYLFYFISIIYCIYTHASVLVDQNDSK